jgi:response regulator of citrate/malate metabolism
MVSSDKHITAILFLEDDKALVDVLHDLIEMNFGENVIGIAANTVERAKVLFDKFFPLIRIIMVDQNLGTAGSRGEDFVHWVREDARFSGTLVAFSASDRSLECLLKAGCSKAVPKPIKPELFIDFVGVHAEA